MDAQETILRACQHPTSNPCEVNMGRGERLNVCADCWNAGYRARKAARKAQLADHWTKYREEQVCAMSEVSAQIGQRVQYFAASMLGLGGFLITGQIVTNRNGIAVIRLDSKFDGKRYTAWHRAWKEAQS
jgi:hypothetical protein